MKVASSSIVSSYTHLLPFHWSSWSFSSIWTPSRLSMSFCLYGRHACTQYSKCGLTRLLCKAMMFLFDLFSYVRLIYPTILFALLTHVAMWWHGLSDWLITTPRSFSSVECAIFCAPIVYSCFGFAWPKCTHLHFPGLNSICPMKCTCQILL